VPSALSGNKETTLNDTSRYNKTTTLFEDEKLLLTGEVQGFLYAPPGALYNKGPAFTYKSTKIADEIYFSTILTDSFTGTVDGLIAYLAISAIVSEDDVNPIKELTDALAVLTLVRFDPEDQQTQQTVEVEELDKALITQIIIAAQNCITLVVPNSVKKDLEEVKDNSKIQDKAIRQLKTVQHHNKTWNELSWTSCPLVETDLDAEVSYRLSLCGRDSSMRVKVLNWRDSARRYYSSFEHKTNQTPKWNRCAN
jgi:hypothetical protein